MRSTLLKFLSFVLLFCGLQTSMLVAQDPTPCVVGEFSSTGDQYWKNITLKITNNCSTAVDLQDAKITFENTIDLDTEFWGDFDPLSYPDIVLRIITEPSGSKFLSTLNLHFAYDSKLPAGKSIYLKYGAASNAFVNGTVKVYLGKSAEAGSVVVSNSSAKPVNVTQNYAIVHLMADGQNVTDIQVPWKGSKTVSLAAPSTYTLTADSISDSNGNVFQGTVKPNKINMVNGQSVSTVVSYATVQQPGSVSIQLQALPSELSGYTGKPVATITQSGGSSSVTASLNWNSTTVVKQLANGTTYTFSAPAINYNGVQWNPVFTPTSLVAKSTTVPVTQLTYQRAAVIENTVTISVTGAPSTLTSLAVKLTPTIGSGSINTIIPLSKGSGPNAVLLANGVSYNVSTEAVSGYNVSYAPQPLISRADAIETITLSPVATGTPVAMNGQLKVVGTQLCNERGEAIQLKGMSTHGIQWYYNCLNNASFKALADDFKVSVVRVALYVQEGGYETDPTGFTNKVNDLIKQASDLGIYVIVDWHMLNPGDPNYNLDRAKKFFTDIIKANSGRKNLLFEICNEPNGVNWSTIKSYADKLIPVIRALDQSTPIIVGTVAWSSLGVSDGSSSQDIIKAPVNFPNIMYSFHFYSASHRDEYLDELDRASNSLPIFVTEFGTQNYAGEGTNDFTMADRYLDLMARKKISWTNWNFSDDFRTGAILKEGTCPNGPWSDSNLKASGVYIKGKIRN